MYFVYVLNSEKDKKIYIGQKNNLQTRIIRHNYGFVKSTRHRRPLTLIHYEEFESRAEAIRFEKYLKSGSGHAYLNDLIGKHGPRITRSFDRKTGFG